MTVPQDWLYGLLGGVLIGLSATMLLLFNGRISGISGITFAAVRGRGGVWAWMFLAGLLFAGLLFSIRQPEFLLNASGRSLPSAALAGLLVGFGTRLGNGCTSGHGVCGISRLSVRSLAATVTFIVTGMITVGLVNLFNS